MSDPRLRQARFAELTPFEVYGLCRLRVDVFVVEQECPYPELDGRDLEPATVHLWFESAGEVAATIRVLDDGGSRAIGRVATAAGLPRAGAGGPADRGGHRALRRRPDHARGTGPPGGLVRAVRLPPQRPGLRRGRHPARADAPGAGRQRVTPVWPREYRPGCGQTHSPCGPSPTGMRASSWPSAVEST